MNVNCDGFDGDQHRQSDKTFMEQTVFIVNRFCLLRNKLSKAKVFDFIVLERCIFSKF